MQQLNQVITRLKKDLMLKKSSSCFKGGGEDPGGAGGLPVSRGRHQADETRDGHGRPGRGRRLALGQHAGVKVVPRLTLD